MEGEIRRLFASRKQFGSQDRRLYRAWLYTWFRYREWLDPLLKDDQEQFFTALMPLAELDVAMAETKCFADALSQRLNVLQTEFPGLTFSWEELWPAWWLRHSSLPFDQALAFTMLSRPPVWLRFPPVKDEEKPSGLSSMGLDLVSAGTDFPDAIGLLQNMDPQALVTQAPSAVIQDIGSQAVMEWVAKTASPGDCWLDFCAGAGGKSLFIFERFEPSLLIAHDTRFSVLEELKSRSKPQYQKNLRILPPGCLLTSGARQLDQLRNEGIPALFDHVLVDAPCTGSGTIRRHPFLRHQLQEKALQEAVCRQREILLQVEGRVRPGGFLHYITCSVFSEENEGIVHWFLDKHPHFRRVTIDLPGWAHPVASVGVLTHPVRLNGDVLFVSTLRRDS